VAFTPLAYPKFNRIKRKLPEFLRLELDAQVKLICENPAVGELKGSSRPQVCALGAIKNFYRDLKRYLKS